MYFWLNQCGVNDNLGGREAPEGWGLPPPPPPPQLPRQIEHWLASCFQSANSAPCFYRINLSAYSSRLYADYAPIEPPAPCYYNYIVPNRHYAASANWHFALISPTRHQASITPPQHQASKAPTRHHASMAPFRHWAAIAPSWHYAFIVQTQHRASIAPTWHHVSRAPTQRNAPRASIRHHASRAPIRDHVSIA